MNKYCTSAPCGLEVVRWLLQVRLMCITDDVLPHAEATAEKMRKAGVRVEVESGESSFKAMLDVSDVGLGPAKAGTMSRGRSNPALWGIERLKRMPSPSASALF